jgi:hypothetical protein
MNDPAGPNYQRAFRPGTYTDADTRLGDSAPMVEPSVSGLLQHRQAWGDKKADRI